MGHRAGISILAALFALISVNVSALGLGDITLKSNLNQPLRAEIELLEVRDLSKAEILVGLATQEDFDRIGVDRVYFLTDLRFDVDLQNKNGPVIRVESKKLVREPYLNFVVIAQWPSGKLLREYTVLMDLPVFAEQAPTAVRAPSSSSSNQTSTAPRTSSSSSQSSTQANPRSSFEAGKQSAPSASSNYSSSGSTSSSNYKSSYSAGDEYTIQRNDTLWEIALAVRPGRDVSVHQAMLALKEANPNAFINNNINLLKRGQILRVPTSDAMKSRGRGQAVNEFAREVNQTSSGDVSAAPLEGRKSYSSYDDSGSDTEGRVKLSSPDDASSSASGSSSGSENNTSTKALEGELSSTMEELDKTSRENDELKSKVSSLEEQIKTMERMIEVSSEDMRALELAAQKSKDDAEAAAKLLAEQEALAAEQAAAAETMLSDSEVATDGLVPDVDIDVDSSDIETAVDAMLPDDSSDDGSTEVESSDVAEGSSLTDSEEVVTSSADEELAALEAEQEAERLAAEAAEMEKAKQATPEPVVAKVPAKSKGIMSSIMDNLVYVGLALLALIGLIVFLVKKVFSKNELDEDEDFLEPRAYEEDEFSADTDLEADDAEDLSLMGEDSQEPDYEEELDLDEGLVAEEDSDEATADPQTEDVVAEADIYIAYGKYDQAEDMLLKALESSPTHHDARLKLLETYAAEQNIEGFDPHFAMIVATGADDLISRGEHLRSTIADAPAFSTADYDTSDFEALFANDGGGDDTVVNFRGNVAADDDASLEGDLDLSSDLDSSLDLDSDLNLDDIKGDDDEEFSLDLDDDSLDSFDGAIDDSSAEDLSLDELADDTLDTFKEDVSLDLSDSEDDDEAGLSLDLDDSEDFDLGDLNLTDDLDDEMDIELDASIDSESVNESIESADLEVDLGDIDASFDMDEADKPSIDDDDLSDVKEELAALDEDDTLVLDVDESLKSLTEAGERSEEAAKAAALSAAALAGAGALSSDAGSAEDDLSLDDDLDLSSLDDELKALSQDLDGDLDEDAMLKELDDVDIDLGDDSAGGLDDDFLSSLDDDNSDSSLKEPSAVMEEPVTDFDEPSDNDDLGALESKLESASSDAALGDEDDFLLPDIDPEGTDEDDLDFLSDSDETATKLDLARAYIDMGDEDGAKDILDEILKEGNDQHKKEAEELIKRIDD